MPLSDQVNRGRVAQRPARLVDRLFQTGYFCAYRLLRAWWFLRRPRHRGAVVALWHHGLLLMVRSSYRPSWDLPGGGVGPREDAKTAALRELKEELCLSLPPEALTLVQAEEIFFEYRYDHISVFEAVLAEHPAIRIDNREIIAAEFCTPAAIAAFRTSDYVARYLARHGATRAAEPLTPALATSSEPALE
ncbi:MAG: NUDIX domain-containing protein [Alphaproteobacteria bacterium]|nr:NUDIX domain-containing protein [Alphaproteobacteria bacterium]